MARMADMMGELLAPYRVLERTALGGLELETRDVTNTPEGWDLLASAFLDSLILDPDAGGEVVDEPDELAAFGHGRGLRALWLMGRDLHFIRR